MCRVRIIQLTAYIFMTFLKNALRFLYTIYCLCTHTSQSSPILVPSWQGRTDSLRYVAIDGGGLSVYFSLPYGHADCEQAITVVAFTCSTAKQVQTDTLFSRNMVLCPSVVPQQATLALLFWLWPPLVCLQALRKYLLNSSVFRSQPSPHFLKHAP